MLGLKNQVKFLGLRNDVQDLYNVMDIFILPSHYEGLPVVGVEAQANGLPCFFSTEVTKEINLTHTAHFLKLDSGPSKWGEAILFEKPIRNMEATKEMSRAGFEIQNCANKITRFYQWYEF